MEKFSDEPIDDTYLHNSFSDNEHVGVHEEAEYLRSNEPIDALNVVIYSDNFER